MSLPKAATSSKSLPKYLALAAQIRREIAAGQLRPGDRLPSFAEMRALHGVAPTTVERIHRELENDGLIERRHGSGTFVAARPAREPTGFIGFLGFGVRRDERFGMSFYGAHLQEGARQTAHAHGLHLMLLDRDTDADSAIWRKLDGVLVAEPFQQLPPRLPTVQMLVARPGVAAVVADDALGVKLAVEHLSELGHRRIAYLLAADEPHHTRRLNAYRNVLRENGLEPHPRWVRHLRDVWANPTKFVGAAQQRMAQWLSEDWRQWGCTALLCQNDQTALGALEALNGAGIDVPGEVSVVGFDGTEAAAYARPHLTTISVPLHQIGATSLELLLNQINGADSTESLVLPTTLQIGGTTAPPQP